jgi:phosphatidyl-myo-inositol dimannoside synthase
MPGGIGNHAYLLAKELAISNCDVTVLTEQREENRGEWQKFVSSNKELRIVGIRRRFFPVITYCQRIFNAYKLTRQNRWHAVIYSGKFSVWLNGIMPRTRSIVVIHGSEIRQRGLLKHLFHRGLKKATSVVCVSDFTKSQLKAHYESVEIDDAVVINNGIRNDWIAERTNEKSLKDTTLVMITVGGIHRRKGHLNVARALPNILKIFPTAKYHIVGLPIEKDRLLELISSNKLNNHVIFHHGLSDRKVRDLLVGSDVFMMLSEHLENGDFEGFGIAIVEAMALGLPAIGSGNSGIADAISDGHSGRLVDPKNIDDITDALRDIVNDYGRYSANAIESAERSRWKHKVKEYRLLIDQL